MKHQENIYLQKFSEWLIIKGHTSNTTGSFTNTAGRFLEWLEKQNIEPENVSYNDVLAYVSYCRNKGNKPRTLQIITGVLKHFYNRLQQDEQVNENPASNVMIKGIKRKTLHEILTTEELENIYKSYVTEIKHEQGKKIPPQGNNELARKRNKIILGLIIYQGIRTEELGKLELQDLQLRESKINIQGGKRTEGRIMKLEGHQLYDLMDYVHQTRKQILEATKKNSNKVFISVGSSLNFHNIMQKLVKSIQAKHPKVKDIQQIRTSVITNWLKIHNLRKVQYMAGHRYVSSTEAYQLNNIEELQDDIRKYHPIG
jgi:site-specific recombinase XerD